MAIDEKNLSSKERKRLYDKEYRKKNKDKIADYRKEYRAKNKDKLRDLNKKWKKNNHERVKELGRKDYHKHRKKRIESSRNWEINNRDKRRLIHSKVNDKRRFGNLRNFILERDCWQCVECGMTNAQHLVIFGKQLTIHHIDGNGRLSENPNNSPDNLQTLCLRCHMKKHNVYCNENERGCE